jgi:hypothetical protein
MVYNKTFFKLKRKIIDIPLFSNIGEITYTKEGKDQHICRKFVSSVQAKDALTINFQVFMNEKKV